MNSKYAIALISMALPCLALGQGAGSYECSFGELQRRVEILTEPGVSVPCEVHYYKDTESPGEKTVLWSAQAQEGYCESKTEEFVAKLVGWGWDCGQGSAAMPAAEPEPAAAPAPAAEPEPAEESEPAREGYDDTDVLSPADPDQ